MTRKSGKNRWRPLTAGIGGLSFWLFTLLVCAQAAQPFSAAAGDVTDDEIVNRSSAIVAVGDAGHQAVAQRAPAAPVESGGKVSIANFAFTPAEMTIQAGGSVTWTNDDGAPHGLEFHDGAKGTDLLLPGGTFSRRFDRPGTYDYHCAVHPYMTGRVLVRAQ